jgi:hypothetical protein
MINFVIDWINKDVFVEYDYLGVMLSLTFLFIAPTLFACILDCYQRPKQFNVKRLHVALTRNDIYIDLADQPDGHNLLTRSVIPYHQIRNCSAKGHMSCCGNSMNFEVSLHRKNGLPVVIIDGIASPQRFMDIVNAMIKKSSETSAV